MDFTYYMPTKIVFGSRKLQDMVSVPLPGVRPMIVASSGGSIRRNGTLDKVCRLLDAREMSYTLYDAISPNPTLEAVDKGADMARAQGCDFIIGLGGGSPIDAGKAIAVTAANGGSYWDYIHGGSGKNKPLTHPALPIVALPTTAGTGTEADPWTVVTNEAAKEKIGWGHESLFPKLSIVDPELMRTVPPQVTAMTGMDAFFHSVEAYLATCRQPASDLLALDAVRRISRYLPLAVKDGDDMEARTQMAWASTAAGLCETYSCCIAHHAMEHSLSAFDPKLPHGAGLVLLSVPFFREMAKAQPQRCAELAVAMGAEKAWRTPEDGAEVFISRLQKLIISCGLQDLRLDDYALNADMAPALTQNAFYAMQGLFDVTPATLHKETVEAIFRQAFSKNW